MSCFEAEQECRSCGEAIGGGGCGCRDYSASPVELDVQIRVRTDAAIGRFLLRAIVQGPLGGVATSETFVSYDAAMEMVSAWLPQALVRVGAARMEDS